MGMVALALARQSGSLGQSEGEGYDSAVIRVTDPVVLTEVRRQLTEKGFGSFSIVDQLDQIRTVFLIIDSVLGLLRFPGCRIHRRGQALAQGLGEVRHWYLMRLRSR